MIYYYITYQRALYTLTFSFEREIIENAKICLMGHHYHYAFKDYNINCFCNNSFLFDF